MMIKNIKEKMKKNKEKIIVTTLITAVTIATILIGTDIEKIQMPPARTARATTQERGNVTPEEDPQMMEGGEEDDEYAITPEQEGGEDTQDTSSTEGSDDTASADESASKDGVYTGSGTGFKGETKVSVTISNDKISDIQVLSTGDDAAYFAQAETLLDKIIDNQGTDGVDSVSGATFSSNGLLDAVDNALAGVK